jgi:hypothetical protein
MTLAISILAGTVLVAAGVAILWTEIRLLRWHRRRLRVLADRSDRLRVDGAYQDALLRAARHSTLSFPRPR